MKKAGCRDDAQGRLLGLGAELGCCWVAMADCGGQEVPMMEYGFYRRREKGRLRRKSYSHSLIILIL